MNQLAQHLKDDYEYVSKNLSDKDKIVPAGYISLDDVLKAHYLICDYFESLSGVPSVYQVRDLNLLSSAVWRQFTGFSGKRKWTATLEIAATLFFGIVKNHAFADGNKRTGLLTLLYYMHKHGYMVRCQQRELEQLTIDVAENKASDILADDQVRCIAHDLGRFFRKADSKFRVMTYQELNQKLDVYDFYLDHPSGNYINVLRRSKKIIGISIGKDKRVLQIGFPGWKKQIGPKALKEVLKACKLTEKYGIDMQAFYAGNESMYKLIHDFEGPLKRLKDK